MANLTGNRRLFLLRYMTLLVTLLFLWSSGSSAVLRGLVLNKQTSEPLRGANVSLNELSKQTVTDSIGFWYFDNIPEGVYSLYISFIGYRSDTLENILVSSDDSNYIETSLLHQPTPGPDIIVRSHLMPYQETPLGGSNVTLTPSEIAEAAGAVGDPVRSLSILPGVARYDDRFNSLVIRGGCPTENGIWIDHIPLPTLNHFSTSGSSGGLISLLNANLLSSATIYLAGFPAKYPDHLSSIWDIRLREGNRQQSALHLEIGVSGVEVVAESPIKSGRGSLVWSVRRSFLEFILEEMDVDVLPKFWDTQAKLTYDIDSSNQIDLIMLYGSSNAALSSVDNSESSSSLSGGTDVSTFTTGTHWQRSWNNRLNSDISFGYSDNRYDNLSTFDDYESGEWSNQSTERSITGFFRNRWQTSKKTVVRFGWSVRRHFGWYEYDYGGRLSPDYGRIEGLRTSRVKHEWRLGSYASTELDITSFILFTIGLRSDYLSRRDETVFSPRSSIRIRLDSQMSLNASVGLYHQSLPGILAYQQESFEQLRTPKARHFTLGLQRSIGKNLSVKIETYDKQYSNQPLFPGTHVIFVLDDLVERYGHFNSYDTLTDNGEAHSRGVELILRGSILRTRLQFLAGGAISKMQYNDSTGNVYDRVPDNGYTIGIESRYHINEAWTLSLRWNLAGGTPYTPYNIAVSKYNNIGILDWNEFLAMRLPDYQSLNMRIQRTFMIENSPLIVYFSIWNLYNHRNVAGYYWNKDTNSPSALKQLGFFPLGGVKYSF